MLLRVGRPDQIHWSTFLRIAVPLAAVVGLFSGVNVILAWLLLLPGSVMLAIHLYRRRQPGLLRTSQCAKLGGATGLFSFAFFAAVIVVRVAMDPAAYRHMMAQAMQEAVARNPTAEAQQMAERLSGTGGVLLLSALGMLFLLAFMLVIGSVSGALAATFSREKAP
jgi:hypothetical protein